MKYKSGNQWTKINKIKNFCLEKINKTVMPFFQAKKQREKTQITNIINERVNITPDPMDIKSTIKEYSKKHYALKFDELSDMHQFLEKQNFPKHIKQQIDNLNRSISIKEIESIINNL